jgi:outer membrane protein
MRFLALIFCFLAFSTGNADDLTVATVDLQTLFKEYPGTSQAQQKYNDFAQVKKQDLADSEEDLNDLQKELSEPKSPLTRKERRRKVEELNEETRDYQDEKNRIERELEERNLEMTRLLMGRIKDVVAGIAKKDGVDLILDSNDAVFAKHERDLTDEVLRAFAELKPDQTELDMDGP